MKRAFLPIVLLCAACAASTPPPVDEQTRAVIAQLTEAIASQPANLPWIYVLAHYQDRARNHVEVARWLARLDVWSAEARPPLSNARKQKESGGLASALHRSYDVGAVSS